MSLEVRIEALTAAVEALTAQLSAAQNTPAVTVESAVAEQVEKKEAADTGPTVEDLQAIAMSKVREDRAKKKAIKDLIASYNGAKVIGDIDKSQLGNLAEKLEAI